MNKKKIYENSNAYAIMLRKLRPFGTALAIIILSYTAAGMPLSDVSAEFAALFRNLVRVSCVGAVGMLMAVWIGGGRNTSIRLLIKGE